MKKLIDADALISELRKKKGAFATGEGNEPFMEWEVEVYINDQDIVDAVEVVRCKDCRYYNTDSEYCGFWGACRHPEHYCGEGVGDG